MLFEVVKLHHNHFVISRRALSRCCIICKPRHDIFTAKQCPEDFENSMNQLTSIDHGFTRWSSNVNVNMCIWLQDNIRMHGHQFEHVPRARNHQNIFHTWRLIKDRSCLVQKRCTSLLQTCTYDCMPCIYAGRLFDHNGTYMEALAVQCGSVVMHCEVSQYGTLKGMQLITECLITLNPIIQQA